jgi:PncC family amidohydrolase
MSNEDLKADAEAALEIVSDRKLNPSEYEFARAVVLLSKFAGLTISSAESLTGGMISQLLTSVSGSSSVFKAGVTAYTPAMKVELLGIQEHLISDVISAEVAAQMAVGIRTRSDSDLAVSCTGVAGPEPVAHHQVGEVHIALSSAGNIRTVSLQLSGSRDEIRVQTSIAIFGLVIDHLIAVTGLKRPIIENS